MTRPIRHLLSIRELDAEQIFYILELGRSFLDLSRRPIKKAPTLRGKTIINLFFEPSTRTRTSFEIAGKRLSADVINISASSSAVKKGESLLDTGKTLAAMHPDAIVIRHRLAGAAHFLASQISGAAIVNAGDGAHEHPTQLLTDLLTLQRHWGDLKGKVITMVGDIAHSRVARSHLHAASKLGYRLRLVAPKTLLPAFVERFPCEVFHDFDKAIPGSHALYMLRIQQERLESQCCFPSAREYHEAYGLNLPRLKAAGEDCLVLHPGPINRGVEIASEAADSIRSRILDQVECGVAVRMAALMILCGGRWQEKEKDGKHQSAQPDLWERNS